MARMDFDKAVRNDMRKAEGAIRRQPAQAKRKQMTSNGQRDELRRLAEALGREPKFPKMAYDARIEIERLSLLLESKQRLGLL